MSWSDFVSRTPRDPEHFTNDGRVRRITPHGASVAGLALPREAEAYRVDKSRSREMGGTGRGSTFRIVLPATAPAHPTGAAASA